MNLLSVIKKAEIAYAEIVESIESSDDSRTDILSSQYDAYLQNILAYKPIDLIELENKMCFVFVYLVQELDTFDTTGEYFQILVDDVKNLSKTP